MNRKLNFEQCILCQRSTCETVQVVTADAFHYLLQAASEKSDDISVALKQYIDQKDLFLSLNPVYHAQCRRSYTRTAYKRKPEIVNTSIENNEHTCKRINSLGKKSSQNCVICNKDRDSKGSRKVKQITTFNRQNEIWVKAKELNDSAILHRIQGFGDTCIDMIANDCCYHNLCLLNFLRQRKTEKKKLVTVSQIFINILPYLENSLFNQNKILTVAPV